MTWRLSDFDFDLPEALIAQTPAASRTASRLLDLSGDSLSDRQFSDITSLLKPGDVLVFNDTRVIKARLYGQKTSGGKIEALIERVTGLNTALAQVKASKTPQAGSQLEFFSSNGDTKHVARVDGREGEFFLLSFEKPVLDVLDSIGVMPLPPYVKHAPTESDETRYQTVYAREPGAVAAPTAGLHFDDLLLDQLRSSGIDTVFVTLHVGAGTFQPVRVDNIADHTMHSERFSIPKQTADTINRARALGRRIVCVGTTSMRTLEGAFALHGNVNACSGETNIFITPGYEFQVVDALITNFHLPKSTLMMLVSAFGGYEKLMAAYRHAIAERYRFFSFGDAMFILRSSNVT